MTQVISRRAEEDLARIYAFLASEYDPEAAEQFRARTERALKELGHHPGLGPHPGWATRHEWLRFWVISRTRYLIYYEWRENTVSIERVLDGRRDVRRIMESGVEDPPENDN